MMSKLPIESIKKLNYTRYFSSQENMTKGHQLKTFFQTVAV